jgi:carboxymethylenebutenolidase
MRSWLFGSVMRAYMRSPSTTTAGRREQAPAAMTSTTSLISNKRPTMASAATWLPPSRTYALPKAAGRAPSSPVGFCFGGRISFNQATSRQDLAGVVGFYGGVAEEGPDDSTAPVAQAPGYRCPVLGLFGGADRSITAEYVEAFGRALESSGIRHELVTYEGAPHSFFDRRFTEHAKASHDAWARVLAFIKDETN